jgi:serine/threonine protein kinase/tetratricopeptide (TPR) repeat protein
MEYPAMSSNDDSNDFTRSHIQFAKGTAIGHYRIVDKIGSGGMGEVYLAEDTELNRRVALKFLAPHLCHNADCRARFKREAQAAAQLSHPNIVTIHEVGEFNGRPFFAMEHIEGGSLADFIKQGDRSLERTIDLSIQICEGLDRAHRAGIIHRDIKPSNILIARDGRARILDFGLAAIEGVDRLTKTGSTMGTLHYMSPEQTRGETLDERSDVFSFGVVLYEMITGHLPFVGDHEPAIIYSIGNEEPEPLARYKSGVPDELQRIVGKMLAKDRAARYQHSDDLLADLRTFSKAKLPSTGVKPRRNAWSRYVVTAAVAVILVVAGYWGVTKLLTRDARKAEPARKMLAVLPFENLSPDPDQEYFSDGLTEELTSKLSQIQSLCVTSRSSSMTFKGSNKTVPEIAKALRVQYVVEGSVRRAGNELRITAQLIDADADAHLWSKTYAGTMDDVFNMQDSVSRAIVDGIKVQLTPDETRRLGKRTFNNTAAFTYYLKGKAEIDKGTEDAMNRGLQYLQQGLDIVGDNALIYSGMAWGYLMMINNGLGQEEYISKVDEYARKARDLDPELPEAHAILGWATWGSLANLRQSVEHFKVALAIDPNSEDALWGLAVVYFQYVGKIPDALTLLERRRAIWGDSLWQWSGGAQFFAGDFPQALVSSRKAYQAGNRQPIDVLFYSMTLAACDSIDAAIRVINESAKTDSTSAMGKLGRAFAFALQADRARTLQAVTSEVRSTCKRDAAWSFILGEILARAGAKEEAYEWLENGVNKGFINYPFMLKDPFLDNIRGDERFKKLLQRAKHEWERFDA